MLVGNTIICSSVYLLLVLFLWRSQTNAGWLFLSRSLIKLILCRLRRDMGGVMLSVAKDMRLPEG